MLTIQDVQSAVWAQSIQSDAEEITPAAFIRQQIEWLYEACSVREQREIAKQEIAKYKAGEEVLRQHQIVRSDRHVDAGVADDVCRERGAVGPIAIYSAGYDDGDTTEKVIAIGLKPL